MVYLAKKPINLQPTRPERRPPARPEKKPTTRPAQVPTLPAFAPVTPLNITPAPATKTTVAPKAASRPAAPHQPKLTHGKRTRSQAPHKTKIAILAGAAALLAPALAFAAEGSVALSAIKGIVATFTATGLGPIGLGLAAYGLYRAGKIIYNYTKSLQPNQLQSPHNNRVVNNLTPRKVLKTQILPAAGLCALTGTLMHWIPEALAMVAGHEGILGTVGALLSQNFGIDTFLLGIQSMSQFPILGKIPFIGSLPLTSVTWEACLLLWSFSLFKAVRGSLVDLYHHFYTYKKKNIQVGNWLKENPVGQVFFHVFGNLGLAAKITFMAAMSKIFATQTLFGGMNLLYAGGQLATGTSIVAAGVLIKYAAVGLVSFGLMGFVNWYKSAAGKPTKPQYRGQTARKRNHLVSTLKWAGGGAAAGLFLAQIGLGLSAQIALTGIVALAFFHDFIHGSRAHQGALGRMQTRKLVRDQALLRKVVFGPQGDGHLVHKPGFGMMDAVVSAYSWLLGGSLPKTFINAYSGCFGPKDLIEARQMIDGLLDPETQVTAKIFRQAFQGMMAAESREAALEAIAHGYEEAARFLYEENPQAAAIHGGQPRCLGNLRTVSGLDIFSDATFSAGVEQPLDKPPVDSKNERSDTDLRVHGFYLRQRATIYRSIARSVRQADYKGASLTSIKEFFADDLEYEFRRATPASHTVAVRPASNVSRHYNSKLIGTDMCQQFRLHHITNDEVIILTPTGETKIVFIPLKVVCDFANDYKERRTIEGSDATTTNGLGKEVLLEDRCFEWKERSPSDIGPSNCGIRYIDNSAHYHKYKNLGGETFLRAYPTAYVKEVPELRQESQYDPLLKRNEASEFLDYVLEGGARLRIYADGSSCTLVFNQTKRAWQKVFGPEEAQYHPDDMAILAATQTRRHEYIAKELKRGQTARSLYQIPEDRLSPGLRTRLENGDVPHPLGDSATKNPWLALRRYRWPGAEIDSVSDGDQSPYNVATQMAVHAMAKPHIRLQYRTPKAEVLPSIEKILAQPQDSYLDSCAVLTWMLIRINLKDGSHRFIPLDINKESESPFANDLWRYIDERKPLRIVNTKTGPKLALSFHPKAGISARFRKKKAQIALVDMPPEMYEFLDQIREEDGILIDVMRDADVSGQMPLVEHRFTRRKAEPGNKITDLSRQLELSDRLANVINEGLIALHTKEEVEESAMIDGIPAQDCHAWVDPSSDLVHISMSQQEHQEFKLWLKQVPYNGQRQPKYKDGELTLASGHFQLVAAWTYFNTTYSRYVPDDCYRFPFEPTETTVWQTGGKA